jgi:hypothetical protein
MKRPDALMREAGASTDQQQLPPLMQLPPDDMPTAEYLLVDDLLTVMMGQVGRVGRGPHAASRCITRSFLLLAALSARCSPEQTFAETLSGDAQTAEAEAEGRVAV